MAWGLVGHVIKGPHPQGTQRALLSVNEGFGVYAGVLNPTKFVCCGLGGAFTPGEPDKRGVVRHYNRNRMTSGQSCQKLVITYLTNPTDFQGDSGCGAALLRCRATFAKDAEREKLGNRHRIGSL
jgi:hypothetical protein